MLEPLNAEGSQANSPSKHSESIQDKPVQRGRSEDGHDGSDRAVLRVFSGDHAIVEELDCPVDALRKEQHQRDNRANDGYDTKQVVLEAPGNPAVLGQTVLDHPEGGRHESDQGKHNFPSVKCCHFYPPQFGLVRNFSVVPAQTSLYPNYSISVIKSQYFFNKINNNAI